MAETQNIPEPKDKMANPVVIRRIACLFVPAITTRFSMFARRIKMAITLEITHTRNDITPISIRLEVVLILLKYSKDAASTAAKAADNVARCFRRSIETLRFSNPGIGWLLMSPNR